MTPSEAPRSTSLAWPATVAPSPNYGPRRDGRAPDMVVLHYTSIASGEAALSWLTSPASNVSAHYLIDLDGRCWSMVDESERAWHAGASAWGGVDDVNSRSIGIELVNSGHDGDPFDPARSRPYHPFPEPQMAQLCVLLRSILERWGIDPVDVVAHSDVAPTRKADPGEKFDWSRLAAEGCAVALPPEPVAPDAAEMDAGRTDRDRFCAALEEIGYGPWPFETLLAAFRRRHRPAQAAHAIQRPFQRSDADRAVALAALVRRERRIGEARRHA